MKLMTLLTFILLSTQGFAHCGTCGEGSADDHQEAGTDSAHHKDDNSMTDQSSSSESVETKSSDDDMNEAE